MKIEKVNFIYVFSSKIDLITSQLAFEVRRSKKKKRLGGGKESGHNKTQRKCNLQIKKMSCCSFRVLDTFFWLIFILR